MELSERRRMYETALTKWGFENQLWMVAEECGELLNAIGKMRRERVTREDVITELADVTIMCEQIAQYIGYDDYTKEMERKLERLKERLAK
jgi:NTP pyrophosphatase (non-canonical NTP hydrolase)